MKCILNKKLNCSVFAHIIKTYQCNDLALLQISNFYTFQENLNHCTV